MARNVIMANSFLMLRGIVIQWYIIFYFIRLQGGTDKLCLSVFYHPQQYTCSNKYGEVISSFKTHGQTKFVRATFSQ